MKTKTDYIKRSWYSDVPEVIDELYSKYGGKLINVTVTYLEGDHYGVFYTVLEDGLKQPTEK